MEKHSRKREYDLKNQIRHIVERTEESIDLLYERIEKEEAFPLLLKECGAQLLKILQLSEKLYEVARKMEQNDQAEQQQNVVINVDVIKKYLSSRS